MDFRILGPLDVRDDSGSVALGGSKPRMVMAVLLLHANEAVHPERLALALWGEDAPRRAVKTLQVYVSRLRSALGDPAILATTPAGYRLRVRPGELDAQRFEELVEAGRRALAADDPEQAATVLREGLVLWRGPPLADLALEGFVLPQIVRLTEQRLAAVELRVQADLAAGRHSELVGELRELVAANPTREQLVGLLMLALYRCGQQSDALDAFHHARRALIDEIGVEPGRELRALQEAVLAQDPGLEADRTVLQASQRGAGALPALSTVLFGRDRDLDAIAALMRAERTRLVTLIGAGGVGKTRLAIEAAHRLAQNFSDGARFVSLAAVAQPADLASATARALAVPVRESEAPLAALKRHIGDRRLLLVLDNFEHLVAAAPLAAALLDACPGLTVLTTSREPTRLGAERLYPVQPLAVPEPDGAASTQPLERYGAVAMFVDRVCARDPAFALDETNASHVGAICTRLNGLPLAIELAAARVGLLSPAELAGRLERSLAVLGAGPRDAPARQQTLRATIDWSFGLLTDRERTAFTRFAVFAGGATVPVAETVTGASLDTLDSLVAKQLLVRRDDRLLMLETVREYALERLEEDPQAQAVRDRHTAWCISFACEATPHLVRADRLVWLARLDAELPNLLAAVARALADGHAEPALRLATAVSAYWWRTNQWQTGFPWMNAVIEQARGASAHARADALLHRARLASLREPQHYLADVRAALDLFRACGDDAGIAAALGHLADAESFHGRFEDAEALSDEAMGFAQRAGDQQAAVALVVMQRAFAAKGYEAAAPRARTAVQALRQVDNLYELASICIWTGYIAIVEDRHHEALAWLTEGLDAARPLEHPEVRFHLRSNQGLAWLFLDELDDAGAAFGDALAVCRAASTENVVDETLLGMAAIAAARGQFARAARIAGAAERHRTIEQAYDEVAIRQRLHKLLAGPRSSYGPERWDRARTEGASLTVHEAIDLALESDALATAARRDRAGRRSGELAGLAAAEVLRGRKLDG